MGFNVDLVAIRGLPATDLHARLKLEPTRNFETEPESAVVGAIMSTGWHIFYFNDRSPPTEAQLAALSTSAEVLFLDVCEAVMVSTAKCWQNGKIRWCILHDGGDHLQAEGDLPDCFQSISDRLHRCQAFEHDDIDYLFNIPPDVFVEVTGFNYDGNPDGYPVESFVIFGRRNSGRKWWQFW